MSTEKPNGQTETQNPVGSSEIVRRLQAVRDTAQTLNGEGYHTPMHAPTQAALDVRFLLAQFEHPPSDQSRLENAAHNFAVVMSYEAMRICLGLPTKHYLVSEVVRWMQIMASNAPNRGIGPNPQAKDKP